MPPQRGWGGRAGPAWPPARSCWPGRQRQRGGCRGGAEREREPGRAPRRRWRRPGSPGRGRAAAGGRAGGGGPLPAACRTLAEARRWAGAWREGGAAAGGAGCCIPGAVTGEALPCAGRARPAPRRPPGPLRAPRRRTRWVSSAGQGPHPVPLILCPERVLSARAEGRRPPGCHRVALEEAPGPGTGTWEIPGPAVFGRLGLSATDKGKKKKKSSFFRCYG